MVLAMTRPTKVSGSSNFQYRRRTPKAILNSFSGKPLCLKIGFEPCEAAYATIKVGGQIKVSLRTSDPALAKQRCADIDSQVSSLEQQAAHGPQKLTHRQIYALAGEIHTVLLWATEEEPGNPMIWQWVKYQHDHPQETGGVDMSGFVDALLAKRQLHIDEHSRARLIAAAAEINKKSVETILAHTKGDYSPDPVAPTLPVFEQQDQTASVVVQSITGLFEDWCREARKLGKAASTIKRYRPIIQRFVKFLGHDDANRVTKKDLVRYKDHLLHDAKKSSRTIKNVELSALKSVFGFGVDNERIKTNPTIGVTLKVTHKEKKIGFSDAGAVAILKASRSYTPSKDEPIELIRAKQWLPLLLAFTAARIGEVALLKKSDVAQGHSGHWTVRLKTLKQHASSSYRIVPLHPQILEQGFIEAVLDAEADYLFIKPATEAEVDKKVGSLECRMREFANSVVREKGVPPNHGWRHRLTTLFRRHHIPQEYLRMITGRVGKGVDEKEYGEVAGLYEAIAKLPHYDL